MDHKNIFKRLAPLLILFSLVAGSLALVFLTAGHPRTTSGSAIEPRLMLAGRDTTGFNLDPNDTTYSQPQAGEPVPAVSRDVDLRSLPQVGPAEKNLIPEFERGDLLALDPDSIDPVLQAPDAPDAMPAVITDFAGLDLLGWGGGWPPDTNGDIGPDFYIQTINVAIGVYDRAGTLIAGFQFNDFFSGTSTPCDSSNGGDPIVLYDDVSGRWIITDLAYTDFINGPYYECIAVSKTNDPVSGGWWLYGLQAHATYLNDYPKLGIWQDGIYMTANLFDVLDDLGNADFEGVRIWALNRDDLIAGSPLNHQYADLGSAYGALLPSHARGSSMPPAGTPNYLGSLQSTTLFNTFKYAIDWNTPANSTLSGPFGTTIASFDPAASVPQPPGYPLDAISDRLMAQLQYSEASGEGALWATHSVATDGHAGIRWYELRGLDGTPSVYQQGTFSPDSTHRWMGSLAVDQDGNMAVVYSASSSSIHPQIRFAGRLVTDTLGTLGQGEATLTAGTGSQLLFTRWGDYAGMAIDPTDECTFWMTTEYYISSGLDWKTRIGAFRFPNCGVAAAPEAIEDLSVHTAGEDAVLEWSAVLTNTNGSPSSIIAYHVYSDTDPYLGSPTLITSTTDLAFTHTGAADGSSQVYYTVVAENSFNLTSGQSNFVGVFPFPLTPGSGLLSVPGLDQATSVAAFAIQRPGLPTSVAAFATQRPGLPT